MMQKGLDMRSMTYAFFAAVALSLLVAPVALAHEFEVGGLTIDHPSTRPVDAGAPVAVYMEIENASGAPDRLVAASADGFGRVVLHRTTVEGDVVKMVPVEAIEIPADDAKELKSTEYHLMILDPKEALAEGDTFPLTLRFAEAGEVEIEVAVEAAASAEGHDGDAHGSHTN